MLRRALARAARLSGWPGNADQVPSRIAEVSDSDLPALVALRPKNGRSSERLGAGQRLGNVGHANIEDGVAVVSGAAADTTRGWRRLFARRDEGVLGRRGHSLCDRSPGRCIPTEQSRVEVAKACGLGTDQFEVNNWISHPPTLARGTRSFAST